MNPDDLKKVWQTPSTPGRLTIDTGLLLNEVRRNEQSFRATIFWRDAREVGIAFVLVPVWAYMGIKLALPWTWYLTIPALIWVGGFMLVDRFRHNQRKGDASESLTRQVGTSLAQIEHQIWLLRNIFWWYLLPFGLSIAIFLSQLAVQLPGRPGIKTWNVAVVTVQTALLAVIVFAVVYWLNQRAVRRALIPRRQELRVLLASLSDQPDQNRMDVNPPST
jgi:hypothetical protein